MATPPKIVYTDSPGALPATYNIPAGLELVVESVFARFNGAAAAGPFKPCLSVYSQDDRLLARVFPGTNPTVGDTAVVTYAPF